MFKKKNVTCFLDKKTISILTKHTTCILDKITINVFIIKSFEVIVAPSDFTKL